MNYTNIDSTRKMAATANNVMNTVEEGGLIHLTHEVDGWSMVCGGLASHEDGIACHGSNSAEWEVIIEHTAASLSCIVRSYVDGSRRTTWAIGTVMNVGIDAAMAHLTNYYCQQGAKS